MQSVKRDLLTIFVLVSVFQFSISVSVTDQTGVCKQCNTFLNEAQCNYYKIVGCSWTTSTKVPNKCIGTYSTQVLDGNSMNPRNGYTANSNTIGSCASVNLAQNCLGMDAGNFQMQCALTGDSKSPCKAIDVTLPCSQYNTNNYCRVNSACYWNSTNCNPSSCANYLVSYQCTYYVTKVSSSAKACTWVSNDSLPVKPSSTNGTCMEANSSALARINCIGSSIYYTWDDANNKCTGCVGKQIFAFGQMMSQAFILTLLTVLISL